jgi:signal transduction histidine kinase
LGFLVGVALLGLMATAWLTQRDAEIEATQRFDDWCAQVEWRLDHAATDDTANLMAPLPPGCALSLVDPAHPDASARSWIPATNEQDVMMRGRRVRMHALANGHYLLMLGAAGEPTDSRRLEVLWCEGLALALVALLAWHPRTGTSTAAARAPAPLSRDVLANVAHELRTPLQSIIGHSNMLVDEVKGPLSVEQKKVAAVISRQGDQLLGTINNMLDLSKLEAGKMAMTETPVSLLDCLHSAFTAVEPQMLEKGLEFVPSLADDHLRVWGSEDRLRQVFVNLFSNAVKFTEQGRIGVRARREGNLAIVEVWDEGIGIAADALAHIFDEYHQADASIRRRFGGSGLGLAISRKLVELHGGTLEASSQPGAGSVFTVRLPTLPRGQSRSAGASRARSSNDAVGPSTMVPESPGPA